MRLSRLAQTLTVAVLAASSPIATTVSAQDGTLVSSLAASPVGGSDACGAALDALSATPLADAVLDPTTLDLDVLYIDALIPHHQAAVAIAREAQARSTRTEVVSLAAAIAEQRSAELDRLRAWRDERYPAVPPLTEAQRFAGLETKLAGPGVGGVAGLADLTATAIEHALAEVCHEAADIDLAFIDATVELTSGAILLSDLTAAQAQNADTVAFAGALSQTLEDDRDQLLSWRDAWYGGVSSDHHVEADGTPTP